VGPPVSKANTDGAGIVRFDSNSSDTAVDTEPNPPPFSDTYLEGWGARKFTVQVNVFVINVLLLCF